MNELYYRPSGKISTAGFLLMIFLVSLAGTALAIPYLFIVKICPIAILCVIMPFLYGGALGLICKKIIEKTKMRSVVATVIATSIGICIFTYFKWAFYISNLFTDSYFSGLSQLIASPGKFSELISIVNQEGTWTIGRHSTTSGTVSGWFLSLVWIGEIAIIAFTILYISLSKVKYPFIEQDEEWAREYKDQIFSFEDFDVLSEKAFIESNPLSILNHKPFICLDNSEYVVLKLYHNFNFTENYISIYKMTYNAKNKKHEEKLIMQYLSVNNDFFNRLIEHFNGEKTVSASILGSIATPEFNTANKSSYESPYTNDNAGNSEQVKNDMEIL